MIRLRKLFTDEVVDVPGDRRPAGDRGHAHLSGSHSITNTGTDPLVTLFFADELYDPANPDTIPEEV